MANTIPGGFYLSANGQPHDASGNLIDLTKLTQDDFALLPAEFVADHQKAHKPEVAERNHAEEVADIEAQIVEATAKEKAKPKR